MMNALERKKMEVELSKVKSAREEMELKIMERKAEIERYEEGIKIQIAKEQELSEKLKG